MPALLFGNPGIQRVVAECTQPQGGIPAGETLRVFEKYLADAKCVDLVYRAVLNRACIEPQSEAVISKAVDLFKQHIARYRPSVEVLLELEAFCQHVYSTIAASSHALRKSVSFLYATIKRLAGPDLAPFKPLPSPASRTNSISASPRVSFNGIADREPAALPMPSRSSMAAPLLAEASGSSVESFSRASSGQVDQAAVAAAVAPPGALLVPSQSQAQQQPGPPDWSIPCSVAQTRFGIPCSIADPSSTTEWTSKLPEYQPSLPTLCPSAAPAAEQEQQQPLSSQQVLQSFVDTDAGTVTQQIWEIGDAVRLQASHGVDLSQQQNARRSGAKLLFVHQPYAQQEALTIGDPEIAFVVGVVCGRAAASALADTSAAAAGVPDGGVQSEQQDSKLYQMCSCILIKLIMDAWLKSGSAVALPLVLRMLQKALTHPSTVIKVRAFDLVYNLSVHSAMLLDAVDNQQLPSLHSSVAYSQPAPLSPREGTAGGGMSSPRGAREPQSPRMSVQSPRFNTFTQPLSPSRLSRQEHGRASFGSAAAAGAAGAAAEALPWGQRSLVPAAPSPHVDSRASSIAEHPVSGSQHTAAKMDQWLCSLLSELLTMLCSMMDVPEPVWTAAAGCLVHLSTHGGHFVASRVDSVPPAALAKLLRCCQQYSWSQELYCHLVRLTVNVLYDSSRVSSDGSLTAAELSAAGGLSSAAALSQQRLAGFGGVLEVVHHFCHAPSIESQSNLLAVILHSLLPPDADDDSVAALVATLCSSTAALATLQGILRVAGSSAGSLPMDGLLTVLTEHADSLDLQLLSTVLLRLEAAVLEGARDLREAAVDLEPVMEATAQAVSSSSSSSSVDLQQAWKALRDLASSQEQLARQLACNWLQRLLLAAFDPRTCSCPVPSIEAAQQQQQQVGEEDVRGAAAGQQHMAAALMQLLSGGAAAAEVLLDAVERAVVHMKAAVVHSSSSSPLSASSSKRDLFSSTVSSRPPGDGLGSSRRSSSRLGENLQRQLAARLVSELWGSVAQWVCRCMGANSSGAAAAAAAAARRQLAVCSRLADMLVQMLCQALPADAPAAAAPGVSVSADRLSATLEPSAAAAAAAAANPTALQAARLFLYGHTQGWVHLLHPEAVYGIAEVLARMQELHSSYSAASCGFQGRPRSCPQPRSSSGSRSSSNTSSAAPTAASSQDPLRSSSVSAAALRHNPARISSSSVASTPQRLRASSTSTAAAAAASYLRSSSALPYNASIESDLSVMSAAASSVDASSGADTVGALDKLLATPWVDDFSDSQLALLLLLLGFCGMDGAAVAEFGVEELLQLLLGSRDVRQRYYCALYLLKHMMLNHAERYWQALRQLVVSAQSVNDEKVLGNPYLQVTAMMREGS